MKKFLPSNKAFICMLFGLMAFASSCVDDKDLYDPDREFPNPIAEIKVPDDFDWKTMNTMQLEVKVTDQFSGQFNYLIEVFVSNPLTDNDVKPIVAGYAKGNAPFKTIVTIPKGFEFIYVRQLAPDGLSSVQMVEITGGKIGVDFSGAMTRAAKSTRAITVPGVEEPTITEDLFPTQAPAGTPKISGTGWHVGGSADVFANYILDTNVSTINVGACASIYVTEDVTIEMRETRNSHHIYVLPGKTLTVTGSSFELQQTGGRITIGEGAKLVVNDLNISNTDMYNRGELIVSGNVNANSSAVIYNEASLNVTGDLNLKNRTVTLINLGDVFCNNTYLHDATKTKNSGTFTVNKVMELRGGASIWINEGLVKAGRVTINGSSVVYNLCKMIVSDLLEFNTTGTIYNDSYIYTENFSMGNGLLAMGSESFIDINKLASFDGYCAANEGIQGIGEKTALVKMGRAENVNNKHWGARYGGKLQVICDEHFENSQYNQYYICVSPATMALIEDNDISIPSVGECNPGWETKPGPSTEPEIENDIDPFTYSYLFEDMWPFYGDYDMNDVVLRIRNITYDTDENNQVSKFSFEASLRAVGAQKRIAGALMLDNIRASAVSSVSYSLNTPITFNVSGSGVEQNQTNAVVPLFDEAHLFMMGREGAWYINTYPSHPEDNVANPPAMTVTIEFNSPVNKSDLNVAYLNFFIITDINLKPVTNNPRREIHLVDYMPTAMGDTSFFGNNNDGSGQGRYYRSKDNLPWGFVVPAEFRWPTEFTKIQDAYSEFEPWVTSGGNTNTDWYNNPTAGAVY